MKVKFLSSILIISSILVSLSGCGEQSIGSYTPSDSDSLSSYSSGSQTASGTYNDISTEQSGQSVEPVTDETVVTTETVSTVLTPEEYQELKIHFLDVGQGDSCFIELPNGETMLIDAAEQEYSDIISTYIMEQGYDTLNYVVASHPHSDHIGGMADVISSFNVKNFYMTEFITTSTAYEHLLDEVEKSGAAVHNTMAGTIILEAPDILVEAVAPKELKDDCNNNSIVVKLTYGDNKFLFTGDAEKQEESDIWTNVKCDVLKVGHHGSSTSSSANFLKKVDPTYAVISCGVGNKYGHPTESTLDRLYERDIQVFRTDLQGMIVFTSNGKDITVDKKPTEQPDKAPDITATTSVTTTATPVQSTTTQATVQTTVPGEMEEREYMLNTSTKKIHNPNCRYAKQIKDENREITTDYDEAIAQGYIPCEYCVK